MKVIIKNSSGKEQGYVIINDSEIKIYNEKKPLLVINDREIISAILSNNRDDIILQKLYDEYYLSTGEIAALYNVCYSNMNRQLKNIPLRTTANANRRNSSYKKIFSQTRKEKISKALKEGHKNGTIKPSYYERTPEIREKISTSLKKYFNEHPQNPQPHIDNWKNGVYDNVDFHIGIGGHFFSLKNNQQIKFRSLLELSFCLMLENDENVITYDYEPFHIMCDNGHSYMPDILINNKYLIELKSKKYVEKVAGIKEKVLYKKEQAEKYCKENNLIYKIIYDTDINFESTKFKRYLHNNQSIVEQFKIVINQPERMVIK